MRKYKLIKRWIWEFPQTLLGYIMYKILKKRIVDEGYYNDQYVIVVTKFPGGISLGNYSIVKHRHDKYLLDVVKHEYGHSIQSKYLGWLYPIIIGIPSLIHNLVCRIKERKHLKYNYYKFYTEKSADILGGVKRNM